MRQLSFFGVSAVPHLASVGTREKHPLCQSPRKDGRVSNSPEFRAGVRILEREEGNGAALIEVREWKSYTIRDVKLSVIAGPGSELERTGHARLDGNADFLAKPHVGLQGSIELEGIDLDYIKPITSRYNVTVVSNQHAEGKATGSLEGKFMGSGDTTINLTFSPVGKRLDFDLMVRIDGTELPAMNDLLRAYAGLDVGGGQFSFYSEVNVRQGNISGQLLHVSRGTSVEGFPFDTIPCYS